MVFAAMTVACIEPLTLEPDIEGVITAFEVEGQTRSSVNRATRTVNIEVVATVYMHKHTYKHSL